MSGHQIYTAQIMPELCFKYTSVVLLKQLLPGVNLPIGQNFAFLKKRNGAFMAGQDLTVASLCCLLELPVRSVVFNLSDVAAF